MSGFGLQNSLIELLNVQECPDIHRGFASLMTDAIKTERLTERRKQSLIRVLMLITK